jgi:hypothetical protein
MLTLTGTLRQFGEVNLGKETPKPFLKIWLEHETPRDGGPADLRIEELLIPMEDAPSKADRDRLMKPGQPLSVVVRAWAKLGTLYFAAVKIAGTSSPSSAEAK